MTIMRLLCQLTLLAMTCLTPAAAQQVRTPPPGSSERAAILAALQPVPGAKVRFIVHELQLVEGKTGQYAYAIVDPSKQEYDGGEFLLKNTGGWRVIWSVTGGRTNDCRTAAVYYQSALRTLETDGIDPDVVNPKLHEEYLRLATFSSEDPDCTALGDLGPELPTIASEPACPECNSNKSKPVTTQNKPRVIADPRHRAPISGADLDGDGKPDAVSIVHILPAGAGRRIDSNMVIANPWDTDASAQAVPDEDTQMALLIENSKSGTRYLLHSPYIELSNNLLSGVPVKVRRGKTSLARAFRKDCPQMRHDFLLMATEAGIDIALFWNANRFEVCWPEEIP